MKVIPWGLYQRSKKRKPNSATDKNITPEKLMMERSESRTNAKSKMLVHFYWGLINHAVWEFADIAQSHRGKESWIINVILYHMDPIKYLTTGFHKLCKNIVCWILSVILRSPKEIYIQTSRLNLHILTLLDFTTKAQHDPLELNHLFVWVTGKLKGFVSMFLLSHTYFKTDSKGN